MIPGRWRRTNSGRRVRVVEAGDQRMPGCAGERGSLFSPETGLDEGLAQRESGVGIWGLESSASIIDVVRE